MAHLTQAGKVTQSLSAVTDNFSYMHLFNQADTLVKSIMVGLLLTSLFVWAVFFKKLLTVRALKKAKSVAEEYAASTDKKTPLGSEANNVYVSLLNTAESETSSENRLVKQNAPDLLNQRLKTLFTSIINSFETQLNSGMSFLAIVGSTSLFVGLFGTVWGIMTSFQSIATSKNTSLAVVAPGIAEALMATALGLAVAIPAVVFYNLLTRLIEKRLVEVENYADTLLLDCQAYLLEQKVQDKK